MTYLRVMVMTFLFGALVACAPKEEEAPSTAVGSPLPEINIKCGNNSCL